MCPKRIGSNQTLPLDLQMCGGDHGIIREGIRIERKNGSVLPVSRIVAQVEGSGISIERGSHVAVLTGFQHPTIISSIGKEELGNCGELIYCVSLASGEVPIAGPCSTQRLTSR